MSQRQSPENRLLTTSCGRSFAATALPVTAIMLMDGMLGVFDAVVGMAIITALGLSDALRLNGEIRIGLRIVEDKA